MSNAKINFGKLSKLLQEMGFSERIVPNSHVVFRHESSGAEVLLPVYRSNQIVLPHHLATVRMMLDGKGLMDANTFDEFTAAASAERSAS